MNADVHTTVVNDIETLHPRARPAQPGDVVKDGVHGCVVRELLA